jgi:DNA transposition AAA+ family ATPase
MIEAEDRTIVTSNYVHVEAMIDQLCKGPRRGGVAHVSGAAGTGKSCCARSIAAKYGFPLLRLHTADSERAMLSGLLREVVGWNCDLYRVDELYARLVEEVRPQPQISARPREVRCLLIDEGDCLDQSPRFIKLNILRDLADESGATIVIFSTAALARRLQTPSIYLEQVTSRIVGRVEFQRPNLRDAMKLADLVEGVVLDRDLVAACLGASRGSIRPLIEIYRRIETAARDARIEGPLDLERALKCGIWSTPQSSAKVALDEAKESVNQAAVKSGVKAAQ